jgi:hypothetical protein
MSVNHLSFPLCLSVSLFLSVSLSFLQAFDQHLNMVLGDAEEIVTTREIDEETDEEIVRVRDFSFLLTHFSPSLFCLPDIKAAY